jgi:predicted Abi (CAAX) family protease
LGGGQLPATAAAIERSRPNDDGWYVSGVPDGEGAFVVQSLVPRSMIRFAPERILPAPREGWRYAKREAWQQLLAGTTSSVLISGRRAKPAELLAEWQAGDRVLVLHVFGGIGGDQQEDGLLFGRSLGHFAYGIADLEIEPLAAELSVAVQYRQVYAHNPEGLISGAHDRWRYLGDRQWGWLGLRPVADILVRFPPFTCPYRIGDQERSPLDGFEAQLAAMMARYRLGDGTGATFVGPANNCSQDSNQALFAALRQLQAEIAALDPEVLRQWQRRHPDQAQRLQALGRFERELRQVLLPFGGLREDWRQQEFVLGSSLEDRPLNNLVRGLGSWRTLLPRLASDTVLRVFLHHGASALVMRSNQVGGDHPSIAPLAPMTF